MEVNDELLDKLDKGLEELTGYDFDEAERQEHLAGNYAGEIGTTKPFQARLAARALNVPYPEIQALSLRDYSRLTTMVFAFLYAGSAKDLARQKQSEVSR